METSDQQVGVEIIRKTLRTPCSTIVKNTGADPAPVIEKIMSSPSVSFGYDALKGIYVDMMEQGELWCVVCCGCECVCVVCCGCEWVSVLWV